jgi:predicted nucleotidyltransferase
MRAQEFIVQDKNNKFERLVADILEIAPQAYEIWFYGSRARGDHKPSSDYDILVMIPDSIVGGDFLDLQLALEKLSAKYNNFDVQASHSWNMISRSAREEGRLIWKNKSIIENSGKYKFLRPGELKGSYTDAQLQALGFKKSQTGSWVIAQDKWKQLVQNKLISETETINEKRKKIKQKSKTRRIAYGGWIYGYPAASGESGEGGGDGGGLEESLNQPYNLIDWDQVDFGQPITTWAALPDGTYLEIEFNQESPAFNDWEVSFHRDDTMNLTGQGDAYRIFATVLFAIRKFVIDQNPDEISFSAFKNKDETGSRQSLYTALAKRYATSLGYTFSTKEDAYHQHYIFRKIRQKNKIQEAIEYQRHLKLINAHMKKMGYQKLGGGADAQVYAKTEDQVIKILIPSDSTNVSTAEIAFVEFYKFCQANQRNPHLPKFFKIQGQDYTDFYIDGERFIQIAQERLTEIPAPSRYDDMLFDMINSVENDAPLERSYPGYELLYKTLQSVSKLGKILGFDSDFIKTDDDFNIMLRGQTLVITDPWVNFKLTENGSEENEEQMDQDDFNQQDPGQPIPFPKGTTSVDVSDPYDWYKLGMIISDLDDANPKAFGTGAPSTVIAFGSEQEEHKFLPYLKKLGLKIHDIDKPEDTQKVVPAKALIKHLEENFADGRNPQDKGDSKRYNVPTKGKISTLRKIAKQGGRRGQLAHWMANMRSGKQKAKK